MIDDSIFPEGDNSFDFRFAFSDSVIQTFGHLYLNNMAGGNLNWPRFS